MRRALWAGLAAIFMIGAGWAGRAGASEPIGLAAYTLEQDQFSWATDSTSHFRIHYLPGSTAERQIDSLRQVNETILKRHLALLNQPRYDKIIDLFYFDSRDQIASIVSRPFRALADAPSLTVLAIRNDDEVGRDAHEIMHVVAFDLWGGWDRRNELAWLSEGLATHADDPCNGYDQTELAAHILSNTSDAVPMDSLAASFREYPEMVGYLLMASFVDFVLNEYGLDTLHQLWDKGYLGLEQTFDQSAPEVERDWHRYVRERFPKPQVPDWPDLAANGCR